jgi:hypothetical protein
MMGCLLLCPVGRRSAVISRLMGHIVGLAQHKFASNVIEKCLQHGNREQRRCRRAAADALSTLACPHP